MFFENDIIDNISNGDSISLLDEDAVTYTGVRSIQEEQTIPDTNEKNNNRNNDIIEKRENKDNEKNGNENKVDENEKKKIYVKTKIIKKMI